MPSHLENPFSEKKIPVDDDVELVRGIMSDAAADIAKRALGESGVPPSASAPADLIITPEEFAAAKSREVERGTELLRARVEAETHTLEATLNARLAQFGFTNPKDQFTLHTPEVPDGFTPAHLDAIREALLGVDPEDGAPHPGLDLFVLPSASDLQDLELLSPYVEVMYPRAPHEADERVLLTSFRGQWWEEEASSWDFEGAEFNDFDPITATAHSETKAETYLRSMRAELETLAPHGAIVLLDTAIKPRAVHYGDTEGSDDAVDPLRSLFEEAFGEEATRCLHSIDGLEGRLLPLAMQKITSMLRARSLSLPKDLELVVTIVPASLSNLAMTTTANGRWSARTNTQEWTSTRLLDVRGVDTHHRLVVGVREYGGAGDVMQLRSGEAREDLGARLAVIIRKK